MKLKIKKVEINLIKPSNGLIGFAHLTLDGGLFLGSIGIFSKRDGSGYRLTYPTRMSGETDINIFHPVSHECSRYFEDVIVTEVQKIFDV